VISLERLLGQVFCQSVSVGEAELFEDDWLFTFEHLRFHLGYLFDPFLPVFTPSPGENFFLTNAVLGQIRIYKDC